MTAKEKDLKGLQGFSSLFDQRATDRIRARISSSATPPDAFPHAHGRRYTGLAERLGGYTGVAGGKDGQAYAPAGEHFPQFGGRQEVGLAVGSFELEAAAFAAGDIEDKEVGREFAQGICRASTVA